uniref:Protein RTF1 homolog n=1 Tax=Elaeis guineensis var. tenera TaxID=51953 RepID=A0A6I9RGX4_ELAGV|nr:protein RTF1 homolog [Elaeis guineensis]XP_010925893.1 protein RTF1 homolog [Elaeis guineensis]XP_010925895.1 protein RTF1 homolog [Elaeis guineensis]XP_029121362.1 protein RTF1 homolog [Elaeis guineensis]
MADLENLLLQAAGRTGTSGRKNNHSRPQSRWRREGSYSDGSDSKDDDSDNPRYNKRKPAGSQVPLKKRLDPPEKDKSSGWGDDDEDDDDDDDDRQSDDESDSAPSVGSDLYRDEADKEELGKMSELDRELILAERSTKIDDYKLKKMARASSAKMEKSRKESPPPLPNRSRSSARIDRTAAKSALDELRAKRMKQQAPEGYRGRFKDAVGDGGSVGAGHQDMSPPKHRSAASPPSDLSNEHESGGRMDSEDERFPGNNRMEDDLLDDSPSRLDPLKFEDIKDITIRRSKLVKWFREPFFEDLIVGCFVRVQVGSRSGARYKLFLVRNVDAADPSRQYKLEHHTTYKMLSLTWGNMSVKYEMAYVSDSPALEKEFKEWQHEVEKSGGRMPTRQNVQDKKEAIQRINNFVYSAATVKQMLQEKKSASGRPVNVAAEKDRLRKEMEVAESRRDEAEVERIRARLKELEDMSRKAEQKDAKAVRLAEMNRKNRAENFKNASELKPVNPSLKAGEAGYDPFSRRWTRSRNYYVSKPGGDGNAVAANGDNGSATMGNGDAGAVGPLNGVEAGVAATAAALEAAAGAGKLVDTSAPVDQGTESNTLHDFELPISLAALQKFGGPQAVHLNFMSRKQKIEATTGYKVPDNDGRRHALTLTVSDYKRRRGLL